MTNPRGIEGPGEAVAGPRRASVGDIGTEIDDTRALAKLLASPKLDLKLITRVCGDVRYPRSHFSDGIESIP